MPRIESGGGGFLAAFLSPKGRVIVLPDLHKHIARFVLRSKVKMVGVTESYDVYSVLDAPAEETSSLDSAAVMERLVKMNASIGSLDNRASNLMGYRAVVPKGHALNLPENYRRGSLEEYHVRRILNGVPEGMDDFIPGTSLPLEFDFRKGCYVGQELTIRTYHKGITRKRVMPVQYYKPDELEPEAIDFNKISTQVIPPQSELFPAKTEVGTTPSASSSSARPVRASGRTGSNVGNIGLALVKLESVAEGQTFDVMDREGANVRAKAFFPSWWPKPTEEQQGSE
ncbi:ccr4 associated factor [Mortierella antarctica]|nr:ccr4 associated factor [Mortierella antarctica]